MSKAIGSAVGIFLLLTLFIAQTSKQTQPYQHEWKTVDSLVSVDQPAKALKIVDDILQRAIHENASPQVLKAIIYKMKLTAEYQENDTQKNIALAKAFIAKTKFPTKNLLHSVIAELYQNYYSYHRYTIDQRTTMSQSDTLPFDEWDSRHFQAEITKHYLKSLKNPGKLFQTAIDTIAPILTDIPRADKRYQPSLLDLLSYRALSFFNSKNENTPFILPSDSLLYGNALTFSQINFTPQDTASPSYLSLRIYQQLLRYRLKRKNLEALYEADLRRIDFVRQIRNNNTLYLTYLKTQLKANKRQPVATRLGNRLVEAYMEMASRYTYTDTTSHHYRPYYKKALIIAESLVKRFPKTRFTPKLKNNIQHIKAVNFSCQTEQVVLPKKAFPAKITYKNLSNVNVKIYKIAPTTLRNLLMKSWASRTLKADALKKHSHFVDSTHYHLPHYDDFQSHSAEVIFKALPQGTYIVFFSSKKKQLEGYCIFTAGQLGYITRLSTKHQEVYVFDRYSGTPVSNATVEFTKRQFNRKTNRYEYSLFRRVKTGKNGLATAPLSNLTDGYYLKIFKKNDTLDISRPLYSYWNRKTTKPKIQAHIYTDRAIYRPGQVVKFKIILTREQGKYQLPVPNKAFNITLRDVNYSIVSNKRMTSNDYGSVWSEFILPKETLTGNFTIKTPWGYKTIAVENYKRPKFQITLNTLTKAYRLGDSVSVSGMLVSYAGASLNGASIRYVVTRQRNNYRYYYRRSKPYVLAQGNLSTDSNSHFHFTVPTTATTETIDKTASFAYTITLTATALDGETQSLKKSFSLSSNPIKLSTFIPTKIIKHDSSININIETLNCDDQPIDTSVTVTVYRYQSSSLTIQRYWETPETTTVDSILWKKTIDDYRYPQKSIAKETVFIIKTSSKTIKKILATKLKSLPQGHYLLQAESCNQISKNRFLLFDTKSKKPLNAFFSSCLLTPEATPGQTIKTLIGSNLPHQRILFEIRQENKLLHREWITLNHEQKILSIPVIEDYRGNITLFFYTAAHNRIFRDNETVTIPFNNKTFKITTEVLRKKLLPGKPEIWTLKLSRKNQPVTTTEILTTLYDQSLDAFRRNHWSLSPYHYYYRVFDWEPFSFNSNHSISISSPRMPLSTFKPLKEPSVNWFGYSLSSPVLYFSGARKKGMAINGNIAPMVAQNNTEACDDKEEEEELPEAETPTAQKTIPIRENLQETAFFFPNLHADTNGIVKISFTTPEALTRWRFMLLAHSPDAQTGYFETSVTTQKPLMILPNAPRFVREGDTLFFPATISNMTDSEKTVTTTLTLKNAFTETPFFTQQFQVKLSAQQSQQVLWKVAIPQELQAVTYRATASDNSFSDGEENSFPVLSNRSLVTETFPLYSNRKGHKEYHLQHIVKTLKSNTIKPYKLTLEYTSNPIWYCLKALPSLTEQNSNNNEALVGRYFASIYSVYLLNHHPRLKKIFNQWQRLPDGKALLSNLEKNESLKNIILNETPWVREAVSETAQLKRLSLLFDINKMAYQSRQTYKKLLSNQNTDGGWGWFNGMRSNRYITQYVLEQLGILEENEMVHLENDNARFNHIKKALRFVDNKVYEDYQYLKTHFSDFKDKNHLSSIDIHYLYMRSQWTGIPIEHNEAYRYFTDQLKRYWPSQSLFLKSLAGRFFLRTHDTTVANSIATALKDQALHSEEFGIYWKKNNYGYSWQNSDIETQASIIAFLGQFPQNTDWLNGMKIWLIKQKQTTRWKSSKATLTAIQALLMGNDKLETDTSMVTITLGNEIVKPTKIEAGSGYFKTSRTNITSKMSHITLDNPTDKATYGAVYWQYFENLDKITHSGTGLSIEKTLFKKTVDANGYRLQPITPATPLHIGDKVVVRLIITSDRRLDFVHLKDLRASAFEPAGIHSGAYYRYGLSYYQSVKDASVDFFFDHLPKGKQVFEYNLYVTYKGTFSNGYASIQCQYAPEFSAHSKGNIVYVR